MEAHNCKTSAMEQIAPIDDSKDVSTFDSSPNGHASPEVEDMSAADEIEEGNKGWFAYIKTRNFWIVLLLG